MSELLRRLRRLEEDYVDQPLVARPADLEEINRIRARLDMRPVDARLKEIGAVAVAAPPAPATVPDHSEARAVYEEYLARSAVLDAHRAYADRVARATSGRGMTPVRPLATMGTGGGPLLCDHCRKPIVLEGGRFHGVTADVAWGQNPDEEWSSYILGGLVVEIQTNGTLRIYHGYPGQSKHCCNVAKRADDKARAAFDGGEGRAKRRLVLAFIEAEFPATTRKQQLDLFDRIVDVMYGYDPGLGVNRPGP